jgi:hypothetical protein
VAYERVTSTCKKLMVVVKSFPGRSYEDSEEDGMSGSHPYFDIRHNYE